MNYAVATNGNDSIPITWGEGPRPADAEWANKKVRVSGRDAGLPEVIVEIKYEIIDKTVKGMNKRDASKAFKMAWDALKQVDVDKAYNEQGKDWENLMDDIIMFYCARLILFKIPIPAIV